MTTNDAAERLRAFLLEGDAGSAYHLDHAADLDAALAAERRATVERLRPYLHHTTACLWSISSGPCDCGFDAILDAERDR